MPLKRYPIAGAARYTLDRSGVVRRAKTQKVIRPCLSAYGALKVNLLMDAGYRTSCVVARLVGAQFCPTYKAYLWPVYRNGDRSDVRPSNLKWVAASTLIKCPRGAARKTAKLSEADVAAIRKGKTSHQDMAHHYGVSAAHIADIRAGRAWGHSFNKKLKKGNK